MLSTKHLGGNNKLRYLCSKHGEHSITYSNFSKGRGCPKCGRESASEKTKSLYSVVKDSFEKRGYILISTEYINTHSKLQYLCHKHGEHSITHANLLSGFGCPGCAIENNSGENNKSWKGGITSLNQYLRSQIINWVKESIESANYTCCITGMRGKSLEVHHQYGFNLLVNDTMSYVRLPIKQSVGEYTKEDLEAIRSAFIMKHNMYSPIVLQKEIHTLFHNIYGRGNNTPQQFQEFSKRYKLNEFTEQLNISA